MNETYVCTHCGTEHPADQLTGTGDDLLCPACLENTAVCRECGTRIRLSDNAGTDLHPLCRTCFDRYYTTCARCGALLRVGTALEAGDHAYCGSCKDWIIRHGIREYAFKPQPIFYGSGPLYMGVELEIDGAGEDNYNAQELSNIANRDWERLYCKHDGSLDDGFELVTHPMTLECHQAEMPWAEVMQKAIQLGYTSHQARTCGLHVHVSRRAFGQTEHEQDACIARILYFVEKNWDELLKFSRRTESQLRRWAARYGYKDQPQDILDHAKKGCHSGRYTCVNLQNEDTIEFRIFRGTLKYNTLIATLQLVQRICNAAICLSDGEIQTMAWTTFVAGIREPELIQYLKERRLYINEPIESGVEI